MEQLEYEFNWIALVKGEYHDLKPINMENLKVKFHMLQNPAKGLTTAGEIANTKFREAARTVNLEKMYSYNEAYEILNNLCPGWDQSHFQRNWIPIGAVVLGTINHPEYEVATIRGYKYVIPKQKN